MPPIMTITAHSTLNFEAAARRLAAVVKPTPLQYHARLSQLYQAQVYLKREDLQVVRSYKLRGAYNRMCQLTQQQAQKGVVCASAGNHAQGVAFSCQQLQIPGTIFMPVSTPRQKVRQTRRWGGQWVNIQLVGDTFDDCANAAQQWCSTSQQTFIPPFDDYSVIEGQGTVGVEVAEELPHFEYLFVPVGGGGLSAGMGLYLKNRLPQLQIIGCEPEGAPSMQQALLQGGPVTLNQIDRFVDGAAVKRVGNLTYPICQQVINQMHLVPEGKICSTILDLYNHDAIVAEPAGALAVAALDAFAENIKGKRVVCVISGSNNDIDRMPEIKERSLQYEGLKHYFLIHFAQRPGALRQFVTHVLGPTDDITRFEYMQKTNKEQGPALVGIELEKKEDYQRLIHNLHQHQVDFAEINKNDTLFGYLI